MSEPALAWCPFPDRHSAAQAAKTLLDERLIVCANILPAMLSIYDWDGERGEGEEAGMLIKTDATLLADAIVRLGSGPIKSFASGMIG
jgi:periplasmic divalent cation tolerance protein